MSYTRPQARVFQDFQLISSEVTDPLRAHISAGNAILHRYSDAAEKANILVGPYDKDNDETHLWPDKAVGSLVDTDSVRVFIDNALLMYHSDLIGSGGTVVPVAGRKNYIRSSVTNYRANGSSYPRDAALNTRDVQIGDVVYVRGADENCEEQDFWTYVDGFAADAVASTISSCSNDKNNADDTAATDAEVSNAAGIIDAHDTGNYNGLPSGRLTETYTLTITKAPVPGCSNAFGRVTSASGTDNVAEVEIEAGAVVDIGTRGVQWTIADPLNVVVGSTASASYTSAYDQVYCDVDGAYSGTFDDTYIVEVTKGGLWAGSPEISVTTTKGLDFSGPTAVSGADVAVPIGANGLSIKFVDVHVSGSSESTGSAGASSLLGLRKGDKFYVTVVSGQNGPIRTLILRHDLPVNMQNAADLDLRLFMPRNLEIDKNRISTPPLVNYTLESTQVVLKAGIDGYDADWTSGGVPVAMPVWSGATATFSGEEFGNVYIEYREWVDTLAGSVNFLSDLSELDDIPGPLDERNPLKWHVFRAFQNSNGTRVAYTAVADPSDLDSWQNVIDRVSGRADIYNFVPVTYDREVLNLFQAHVAAESSPEAGNWKGMFVNLRAVTDNMLVGQAPVDSLNTTSTNGEVVLATVEDDTQATGTQYTMVSVPAGNVKFVTYGVRPGDVLRTNYTTDAFGTVTYDSFVVDRVLSENTLLLQTGLAGPVNVAQKIEIWHHLSTSEIVTDLKQQAGAYSDRRVVAIWPDFAGTAGNTQEGTVLCAAVAGLVSGIPPHQGMTNIEIKGFDDLSSRTIDMFSAPQLDELAGAGIFIITEDRNGVVHVRHGLTTSTVDLNRSEEMIRRNYDSMSYLFLGRIRPLIGRANVTPSLLQKLRHTLIDAIKFLKQSGYTDELGAQLIEGTIATDTEGNEILNIHPLNADRVEVVLNLDGPEPLNNVDLHLVG